MSDLTAKFATLEEQMASQNSAILAGMSDINDTLALLNNALDLLNNNGATNTRYLLAAIGANSPCSPCPVPTLTIPPVDDTVNPVNADKCLRVQALLQYIGRLASLCDVLNNFGVGLNFPTLISGVQDVITAMEEPTSIPEPSYAEGANMVAQVLNYAVNNFGVGTPMSSYWASIVGDLRQPLFLSSSPAAAQAQYASVISGSSVPFGANQLMQAIGYNEAFSYFLDPANEINTTGLDGSVCGLPEGCLDFTTDQMVEVTTESGPAIIPDWEIYGITPHNNPGHVNPVWIDGEFPNWTYNIISAPDAVYHEILGVGGSGSTTSSGIIGVSGPITLTFISATPFELHFCPPEE